MDRNQVIGFVLIGLLFAGLMYFNQPSEAELKRQEAIRDSLAAYQETLAKQNASDSAVAANKGAADASGSTLSAPDSTSPAKVVKEEMVTLEHDKLAIQLSNIGGKIAHVQVKTCATDKNKKYRRYDSTDLVLTTPENTFFGFEYEQDGKRNYTDNLPFEIVEQTSQSVTLRASVAGGNIVHRYNLVPESYRVEFSSKWEGLAPAKGLKWENKLLLQEKAYEPERDATTVYYKERGSSASSLSEMGESDEEMLEDDPVEWVSFKQQFFNQTLVPKNGSFSKAKVLVQSPPETNTDYLKTTTALVELPQQQEHQFWLYLGPNHYQTLNRLDIGLEDIIPLGWGIFGWVNKFLIIPVFNLLSDFIDNYGLIILILTIFIKVILLFFTYKAFMSGAKMRALKPELDALKKKHKDDMQAQQMEQMQLYRTTGVSPFGGCLPMILQFPILIAMFRFFPSSIELRQESFLWADDLSSYDSIWDFGYVPVINFIYGDHVSLFALLMTVATFIYTVINQRYQPTQQKELKYLPYIMPLFFLSFLNNYSSALSYYYFLANLISIGQTYLFKAFVDEKKLRAKIEENKQKPATAKSGNKGMQGRLQKMLEQQQKKQQAIQQQGGKKKKR